jgi:hypothetical protein
VPTRPQIQQWLAALVLAGVLTAGTLGLGHAYAHGGAAASDCVTCRAVHSTPAVLFVVAALLVLLSPAPGGLLDRRYRLAHVLVARPATRGPPLPSV